MIDGLFSLTNLLFFPYHAWIDIQLEMKVRLTHNTSEAFRMLSYLTTQTQRQLYFDPILNPSGGSKPRGSYPIIEWADPRFVLEVAQANPELDFDQKVKRAK